MKASFTHTYEGFPEIGRNIFQILQKIQKEKPQPYFDKQLTTKKIIAFPQSHLTLGQVGLI